MSRCPKCNVEYPNDVKSCEKCGYGLERGPDTDKPGSGNTKKEVFLTSAANSFEAEILEALLTSSGIPVLKKFREAGGYLDIYMGSSNFGVDLYVPSGLLEKARDIIENQRGNDGDSQEEEELNELNRQYNKKRRIRTWIIILFFLPGLIWILTILLQNLFRWIR